MKSVNAFCEWMRTSPTDADVTARGNLIFRKLLPDERYTIDFADDFAAEGWQQFDTDQDAPYFGVWVNPVTRTTLTYAEGDWSLVECPTVERYNAEIQNAIEFYGQGYIAKTIDNDGTLTTYVQDRSRFLIQN